MKLLAPYITVLRKYAVFEGRSTRTEYWGFVAVQWLIGFLLGVIPGIVDSVGSPSSPVGNALAALTTIYSLATIVPSLAVGARRLHDTNRSGWWLLLVIPGIGFLFSGIFILVLALFGLGFGGSDSADTFGALLLVALGLLAAGAAAFITLLVFMVLPGNDGPNKYGDKPEWPETSA